MGWQLPTAGVERPWWLLPLGHLSPKWWWPAGVALVVIGYLGGPDTQFPLIYTLPVILAAWYSGRGPAVGLATVLPLVHSLFLVFIWKPEHLATAVVMTIFRGVVVLLIGLWFERLASHEAQVRRHVETLEGLLPICIFCKSIKNHRGQWEPLEPYLSKRSDTQFSHCYCPVCQRKHFPDLYNDRISETPPPRPAMVAARK
ncbi:MAG TPA: hypothetical protein VNZ26_02825 [Vicinamibacterales bacterium]|nr:hypothetical protein [Vicinamibacterales bacterium]